MKKTIIVIFCLFGYISFACAETVILKSGNRIQGKILEDTPEYVKINYSGKEIYFEHKYIRSIERDAPTQDYFKQGMILASAGNLEEADNVFAQGARENSNDAEINGALSILNDVKKGSLTREYAINLFQGSRYLMEDNYRDAVKSLERAWEVNPQDSDVNFNLGLAHYFLKDYDLAIVYLTAVKKIRPNDAHAFDLLGRAYYIIGKYKDARENLMTAQELFSSQKEEPNASEVAEFMKAIPSS